MSIPHWREAIADTEAQNSDDKGEIRTISRTSIPHNTSRWKIGRQIAFFAADIAGVVAWGNPAECEVLHERAAMVGRREWA